MAKQRGLAGTLRHATKYPERTRRYVRRLRRDLVLRMRHRDHLEYYGAVVSDDIVHGNEKAVSLSERPQWRKYGQLQFDYLIAHGLTPDHRVLEIGCGNLRAGWLMIDYLDAGHYYGVDIANAVLFGAQETIVRQGVVDKVPYLSLVRNMHFDFLPSEYFDVVHAHSVFSHCPLPVIEECFANVGRIMKPSGFFDFTFNKSEKEFDRLREDFYYRTETLIAAAERHGLRGSFMDDWEPLHPLQSKIRITKA
jgi:SAM-dependent methyltransferase